MFYKVILTSESVDNTLRYERCPVSQVAQETFTCTKYSTLAPNISQPGLLGITQRQKI